MRVGEKHLLAAFRGDVHAGGDEVEAPGAQAGDQRAPFGEHRFDGADLHALEDLTHDFRRLAGDTAIQRRIGERRLVGVADADAVAVLDLFQGIGLGDAGETDAGQGGTGDQQPAGACRDGAVPHWEFLLFLVETRGIGSLFV